MAAISSPTWRSSDDAFRSGARFVLRFEMPRKRIPTHSNCVSEDAHNSTIDENNAKAKKKEKSGTRITTSISSGADPRKSPAMFPIERNAACHFSKIPRQLRRLQTKTLIEENPLLRERQREDAKFTLVILNRVQ